MKERPHAVAALPPTAIRENPRAAKLAFEVALGYHTPEELQLQFGLGPEQYELLVRSPAFKAAVSAYRREIDENGQDFKIKARKLAFIILDDLIRIAKDTSNEVRDRMEAIREISRLAGYGLKDSSTEAAAPAFSLSINLGTAGPTPVIIEHKP